MHTIPEFPCQHCPWRLSSPRFVWPIERFNVLRLERLGLDQRSFAQPNAVICLCSFAADNGSGEILELPRIEMRPTHTSKPSTSTVGANQCFFPSFEAMADANGAGLFDWTAQLDLGDLVVHFRSGLVVGVLEVVSVCNGIVSALGDMATYRFNSLGYEMKSASDSRILPSTRFVAESIKSR